MVPGGIEGGSNCEIALEIVLALLMKPILKDVCFKLEMDKENVLPYFDKAIGILRKDEA